MSTGFEKKKKEKPKEHLYTQSVDSFDITSKFQEYFPQVKDPRVEEQDVTYYRSLLRFWQ